MSTIATSAPSSRAAHIEDIFDENLLREMWMEATDNEAKRQIRSRMYKLREERLKNFYNKEANLETILKTDDSSASEGHGAELTHTHTSATLIEDGLVTNESTSSLQAQISRKVERSRQYTEVKGSGSSLQVISESSSEAAARKRTVTSSSTTTSSTTKSRASLRPASSPPPPAIKDSPVTVKNGGKTLVTTSPVLKSSARRTDAQSQRKTQSSSQKFSTDTSSHSRDEVKAARAILATSSTPPPTKKVSKGMLSPPTTQRATSIVTISTSPTTPKALPRFMSSTKSRDLSLGANPHIAVPHTKKEVSPIRSPSPDVRITNGGTHKKPLVNGSPKISMTKRSTVITQGSHRTDRAATITTRKEKISSQSSSSRETSLSPTRRPVGKDQETNGPKSETKDSKPPRRSSPSQKVPKAQDKLKTKAEESIIEELDNLDSYLLQRSNSPEIKKPVVLAETSVSTTKAGNLNARKRSSTPLEKEVVKPMDKDFDVMEAGIEPPFTRTTYKYGCTDPEPPKGNGVNKRSNLEDEIIADIVTESKSKLPKRETSKSPVRKLARSPSREKATSVRATEVKATVSKTSDSKRTSEPARTTDVANISKKPVLEDDLDNWGKPDPDHRIVKKAGVKYDEVSDDDDYEDPRTPQKRIGGLSKGLESPGAVLLAKSLFESKASEAAMDKSSGGFQAGGSGFKVTKKAAIFEARSRGERLNSMSSESSHATTDPRDLPDDFRRESITDVADVGCASQITKEYRNVTIEQAHDEISTSNSNIRTSTSTEARRESDSKPAETSPTVTKKNSVRSRSNSVLLDARLEALVNRSTKTSHSREERKADQTDLSAIDDVQVLYRLLDTAADYEGRMAIRSRIRFLTREKSTADKSAAASSGSQKKQIVSSTPVSKIQGSETVKKDNSKPYGSRKSSKEVLKPAAVVEPEENVAPKQKQSNNTAAKPGSPIAARPVRKRSSVEETLRDRDDVSLKLKTPDLPERTKSSPTKKSVRAVAEKFESVASRNEPIEPKTTSTAPTPTRSTIQNQVKKYQLNLNQEEPSNSPRKTSKPLTDSVTDKSSTKLKESRKSPELKRFEKGESAVRKISKDRISPEKEAQIEDDTITKTQSRSTGLYSTRKSSKELRASEEPELKPKDEVPETDANNVRRSPSPKLRRSPSPKFRRSPSPKSQVIIESGVKVDIEKKSDTRKPYSSRRSSSPIKATETKVSEVPEEVKPKKQVKSRRSSTPTLPKTSESEEPQADHVSKAKQRSGRKSTGSPRGTIEIQRRSETLIESEPSKTVTDDKAAEDYVSVSSKTSFKTSNKYSSRTGHDSIAHENTVKAVTKAASSIEPNGSPETKPKRAHPVRKSSSKELKVEDTETVKKESVKKAVESSQGTRSAMSSYPRYEGIKKVGKPAQPSQESSRSVRDQGMDAITSSYGVGPIDDDGTPLFGLRALKKIKQTQETMAYSHEKGDDSAVTQKMEPNTSDDSDQGRRDSLRVNDNYGLRALRKNSGTANTMLTASFPDRLDQNSESSVSCLSASTEERPPVSTSPKSILKKTSSFSSNKSGSKTDVDPFGATEDKVTSNLTSSTTTRTELTTSMPHLSHEKAADYQDWKHAGDQELGSSMNHLSRGHVGKSSVREMSRKFETPKSTSSTSRTVEIQKTVSSITTNYEKESDGSDGEELEHTRGSITGSGRSFLNDHTKVTGVADLMDRMSWTPQNPEESNEGTSLLNKFLGAQVLMQGIEPMLQRGNEGRSSSSVTMSKSLVINGIDIDEEMDTGKLRELLEDCSLADDKGRIETRLKALGASGLSVSQSSTRSADMTGELMPFILGQLQSSLESIGASAGGGGNRSRSNSSSGQGGTSRGGGQGVPSDVQGSASGPNVLPQKSQNSPAASGSTSTSNGAEESAEECLFDSGTESGEDGPATATAVPKKKPSPPPAEFSSFMEGLRHSLTRDGIDLLSTLSAAKTTESSKREPSQRTQPSDSPPRGDADLVQQVDRVLSLLRDTLVKDPNALNLAPTPSASKGSPTEPGKGKELIALIDRLKSSLNSGGASVSSKEPPKGPLPFVVGSEGSSAWPETRPPEKIAPTTAPTHPWALKIKPFTPGPVERRDSEPTWPPVRGMPDEEVPWKIRAVKKRAVRSRSIGVSEEEIAEARRYLEEEAFRLALESKTPPPQPPKPKQGSTAALPTWRAEIEKRLNNSVPRPFVRTESCIESRDDSLLNTRLKPFRTFSLDSPANDPSQSFFTPEEVVQIAVHKAAINKQMEDEAERRRRRGSLTSAQLKEMVAVQPTRDLSVGLPKPYSAPALTYLPSSSMSSSDESRQTVRRRSSSSSAEQLVLYPNTSGTTTSTTAVAVGSGGNLTSPQRIENVQISLKELNSSSEFPQLQIAITLNTNSPSSASQSSSDKGSNGKKVDSGAEPTQGSSEDTDRSSSSKVNRYKSKSERKKKLKRANTLDFPQQASEDPEGDDEGDSDPQPTQPPPKSESDRKFEAFMAKAQVGTNKPTSTAYLSANDKFWNNRFSNLKTSFESSSQGSSPSVSPVPLSPNKPRHSALLDLNLQPQSSGGFSKPVWAQAAADASVSAQLPSSVRNKLSVFESQNQSSNDPNHPPPPPPKPYKSSILSKKESFEKKFAEESKAATVVKPKPIQMKAFEQVKPESQPPPLPPKKQASNNEGVHMVHATKSAIEAMQKSTFAPPPRPMQPQPRPAEAQPWIKPEEGHHYPPRIVPQPQRPADALPWKKPEEAPAPQSRVPPGITSGVRISKAMFESKNAPAPPVQSRLSGIFAEDVNSSIAGKRNEFENFQKFRGQPPLEPAVPRNLPVFAKNEEPPRPRLSVFGVARSFDETFKQKLESTAPRVHFGSGASTSLLNVAKPQQPISTGNKSAFARQVSNSAPSSRRHSESEDELSSVMQPVMSKVMRGPAQQRATVTRREMSSLGDDHPSAQRIRNAVQSLPQSASLDSDHSPMPKFTGFPPPAKTLQLPQGLVKSHSGDSLIQDHGHHQQQHPGPPTGSPAFNRPLPPIPRQKSLSDFPRDPTKVIPPTYQPLGISAGVSVSSPSNLNANPNPVAAYPKTFLPSNENLKRTSSGSSIFDRAKSLFISTQDAAGLSRAPVAAQRKAPPSLPRSSALFPKQYEAQMSPESKDKKTRAVESYFKFPGSDALDDIKAAPIPAPRARYARAGRKDEAYHTKIRKSASQGTIRDRQRSFSDPDEDEEDVDSIFESLFKASVESKSAKAIPGGSMTSEEKLKQSQTQSKQLEQSVKISDTGMSAKMSMQKSSKSSSSFSSSTKSSSSTVESSGGSPFSKFKQLDDQNSKKTDAARKPLFKFTNPAIKASANSAKDMLLYWAQCRTRDYQHVNLENFSSSWSDGMAFCALIHNFFPEAFDYQKLDPKNRRYNFDLAFKTADEKAGIYPLLDTEDMITMGRRPDWKCVFTYVQSMYQKLKDL